MTEKSYRVSKLTIEIVILIVVGLIGFFLNRLVAQDDENNRINRLDHKDIMYELKGIKDKTTDMEKDIAIIKEWKRLVEEADRKHNTRGGKSSTVKEAEEMYNNIQEIKQGGTQIASERAR